MCKATSDRREGLAWRRSRAGQEFPSRGGGSLVKTSWLMCALSAYAVVAEGCSSGAGVNMNTGTGGGRGQAGDAGTSTGTGGGSAGAVGAGGGGQGAGGAAGT